MLDYIDGYNFSEIAHFKIDLDRYDLSTELFRSNAIIFCKTDALPVLFNFIKLSARKYILISHMSDFPITLGRFQMKPDCIRLQFAQNAVYDHPNIISVPIGLENHVGGSKGIFTDHDWFCSHIDKLKNNTKEGVYCNWKITNLGRSEVLKKLNVPYTHEFDLSYYQYCINMSKHQFIICPPGNGVDTIRFWEALYMGCTPIVLRHQIYRDFNLPIIQVNN